jgi:hypothetical protein
MFAPFYDLNTERWFDWCGVEAVDSALSVSGPSNTNPINMPMLGLESACEVVPAALTVQVMNPASLQNADGLYAMARVNQQLNVGGSTVTYDNLAARVVSFYAPRILTGGKLALRGVKSNAYPLDMSEYSKFSPIVNIDDPFSWTSRQRSSALSPIVFVQQNTTPRAIEFMVTIEWRVRFDPGNPATASHTHHDTLPDEIWNGVVKAASSVGPGVEELAEDAAAFGLLRGAAALAM